MPPCAAFMDCPCHQEVLRYLGTEWEKELKEIWNTDRGTSHDNYIALVSFIAELLASQRKTLLREVEEVIENCTDLNFSERQSILSLLAPSTDL